MHESGNITNLFSGLFTLKLGGAVSKGNVLETRLKSY